MKCTIQTTVVLFALLLGIAEARWTLNIVSVEAYINGHKKQRNLLLARSTSEYSNKLLREYSCRKIGDYKELGINLDKYTRAFDAIDVMYQSLRAVLNVEDTYTSASDRIDDYKSLLEDSNAKILKCGHIESVDTLIIPISTRGLRAIAREGEQLYRSVNDLVLYATEAAACSTSNLLMASEAINRSLDNTEWHLNRAYFKAWQYIQVHIGYWKTKVYHSRTMREVLDDAFGRRHGAGRLDYQRQKEKNMNRELLLMAAAVTITTTVRTQYVTYNHDSPKQNRVTAMEAGTGALSPDLYYSVLHNRYKKSVAAKNKLPSRTLAGVDLYNQVDEAEAIDSVLVKQAKIETLGVADRQADVVWLAEGDKISRQMDRFRHNVDRIFLPGGIPTDKER